MPSETVKKWLRNPSKAQSPDPATAYLGRLGHGSRRSIRQALETIAMALADTKHGDLIKAEEFRWESIHTAEVAAVRKQLIARFAPATANKMLSALRGVLRACRDLGLMNEADFQAAVSVANVPSVWHPPEVSVLGAAQVRRLYRGCAANHTLAGRRDAALLTIFLSSGLRRTEAAGLNVGDFDPDAGAMQIRSHEPLKCRTIYLQKAPAKHLLDWLAASDAKADPDRPLLLAVNKSGRVQQRRLTDQAIYSMIHRIGIDSGLPMVTSRALRLTYVVALIARGLSSEHVQALAGHASWLTTSKYAELADRARQRRATLPKPLIDLPKTLRSLRSHDNIQSNPILPEEKGNSDGNPSHDRGQRSDALATDR